MHTRTKSGYFLIFLLILSMVIMLVMANVMPAVEQPLAENIALPIHDNIQTYITEEGEVRTIYWAKGIEAPRMLSKGETAHPEDRVFVQREDNQGGTKYVHYSYPIESGRGYYDLNKNPMRADIYPQQVGHHCYLAAAMNQLYWWFDQNRYYINKYVDYISKGIYKQFPGLRPITDMALWQNILTQPQVVHTKYGYKSMELSDDALYNSVFRVYLDRDLGYFSDLVWDYFINGYSHYHPHDDGQVAPPANSKELWRADPNGGLFYDIFGKEKLSFRQTIVTYELFNEVLKDAITSGKGIVLDYLSVGNTAHAITLWGAEFDEAGNVQRVYLTDSDDYDISDKVENDTLRGLYSNEIVKGADGKPRLSTRADRNPNIGSVIHELDLLSLGQEQFEKALEDTTDPLEPKFEQNLTDQVYSTPLDEARTLEVKVKREDRGEYFYQWYKATDAYSEGELLKDETRSWIMPKVPPDGVSYYYYCVVTNIKNGKRAISTSNRARIYIDVNVTHAAKPTIKYATGIKSYYGYEQYEQPKPLTVHASAPDNGTITYQWYHSLSKSTTGGEMLEGETSSVFYPNNVADWEPAGSGTVTSHYYYCVATNTNNSVNGMQSSSATVSHPIEVFVTSEKKFVTAMTPILIHDVPSDVSEDVFGALPPLTVGAKSIDHGILHYQWYMADGYYDEGTAILGANESTYTPMVAHGSKYYYCKITNVNDKAVNANSESVVTNRTAVTTSSHVSTDCNIYNLTATHGVLSPAFEPHITTYTLQLAHNEASSTLSATYAPTSQVTGLGNISVPAGSSSTIIISVRAESGATKEYAITITRDAEPPAPPTPEPETPEVEPVPPTPEPPTPPVLSGDNKLTNLAIEGVMLSPLFSSSIFEYTATVEYVVSSINITPTLSHSKAHYSISANASNLVVGMNKIIVTVTAENGNVQEYVINVTRKAQEIIPEPETPEVDPMPPTPEPEVPEIDQVPPTPEPPAPPVLSGDNKLTNLAIEGVALSPLFSSSIFEYTATVEYAVSSINITPTLSHSKAHYSISANASNLVVGMNKIIVTVTAENGNVQEYVINVTRKAQEIIPEPETPEVDPMPPTPEPEVPEIDPVPPTPAPELPPTPEPEPPVHEDNTVEPNSNSWIWITATTVTTSVIIIVVIAIIIVRKKKF